MIVLIDERSAQRLLGEGAIRYDADTGQASRDGNPISITNGLTEPVLVDGTCHAAVRNAVARLEERELAAWQVIDDGS